MDSPCLMYTCSRYLPVGSTPLYFFLSAKSPSSSSFVAEASSPNAAWFLFPFISYSCLMHFFVNSRVCSSINILAMDSGLKPLSNNGLIIATTFLSTPALQVRTAGNSDPRPRGYRGKIRSSHPMKLYWILSTVRSADTPSTWAHTSSRVKDRSLLFLMHE